MASMGTASVRAVAPTRLVLSAYIATVPGVPMGTTKNVAFPGSSGGTAPTVPTSGVTWPPQSRR